MPTYEYVCETCQHEFEVFQGMNAPRLTDCPVESCGGTVRRKIGTGAGLIFKGSGFYQTDYRSESYKEGAKKESSSGEGKSSGESGGGGGGDSKSEGKATEKGNASTASGSSPAKPDSKSKPSGSKAASSPAP